MHGVGSARARSSGDGVLDRAPTRSLRRRRSTTGVGVREVRSRPGAASWEPRAADRRRRLGVGARRESIGDGAVVEAGRASSSADGAPSRRLTASRPSALDWRADARPDRASRSSQSTVANQVDDVLAMPQQLEDALWRVESAGARAAARRASTASSRCSCAAWAAARSAATSPRLRSATRLTKPLQTVRGYELPLVGDARLGRPVRELLRQHRGDARLLRGGRRARRDRGSSATTGGRLAEAARADGVPVIPLPAGLQPRAAVAYMLVSALEVAAPRGRRAAACARRSTRPRRILERPGRGVGAGRRLRQPREAGRPARQRAPACACTAPGPTGAVARRWKTQINENAKVPAFVGRAARGRPQRDRRLGGRGRARQLHGGLPGGRRPASARAPADRADRRA